MEVLTKICPGCGFIMNFSVDALCTPGAETPDIKCACCGKPMPLAASYGELPGIEPPRDVDAGAIESAIARQQMG
jgi:hypothetical protein